MQVKTYSNYIHIAPRKVMGVADLIRGLDVLQAEKQLLFSKKRAAQVILKALKSGIASAIHNFSLTKDNLYILEIKVSEAPKIKRWQAAAFGVARPITKKTSHLTLVLDERVKSKKKVKSVKKEEEIKKAAEKQEVSKKQGEKAEKKWVFREKEKEKIVAPKQKGTKGFIRKIFRRKSG